MLVEIQIFLFVENLPTSFPGSFYILIEKKVSREKKKWEIQGNNFLQLFVKTSHNKLALLP